MFNWLKYFCCLGLLWGISFSNGYAQLKADFTTSNPSGCTPVVVTFKDNSTGNPDRWSWDISQPGIYATKDISAVFVNPGSYTIKLTVYKGSDSSSITRPGLVNVYDIPVAAFEANKVEGCKPLMVNFTNKSTPGSGTISSAIWDFGDGNSGNAINPMHTFRTSGRYNVTLTVGNSFGCKRSIAYPNYIHVFDSVKAGFNFTTIPSCGAPFPVQFRDTSVGKNIVSWSWSFGDGQISDLQHPTHNYASVGTYVTQLVTRNIQGCTDTIRRNVSVVSGNFLVSFTHPARVCKNSPVSFTNTSSPLNLADSAFWDFGDGGKSKNFSPTRVYSVPGTYKVTLTMYFGTCKLVKTSDVEILPGPQIDFTGSPLIACEPPLTVNLTSKVTNGSVRQWVVGTIRRPQANPVVTLTDYGNYNVSLVAETPEGCLDTLTRANYIQIQGPQILGFPGLPFQGCFPWTHRFTANVKSFFPITKWEWDFGDGRTTTEPNPVITYSERGDYVVTLKITTDNGCIDSLSTKVKGGVRPGVSFTATPTTVCPSELVTFLPNITGAYDSLRWILGDGTISFLTNPEHYYKDTGFMNISLFVFDNGCEDSLVINKYIYVTPPIARFGNSFICTNQFERKFLDSSFGATSWQWNFGDGQTSNLRNPTNIYKDTGRYLVSLTVSDGKCFHTSGEIIYVLNERPDFVTTQNGNCDSTVVLFKAEGNRLNPANIVNYAWRFNDGVNYPFGGQQVKRIFKNAAILGTRLTITDLNGCVRSENKDVDIKLLGPIAKIAPVPNLLCLGSNMVLQDSSYANPASPIVKWTWDFGDGTVKTFTRPPFNHNYKDTGIYTLKLTVEDGNGCIDSIQVAKAVGVFSPKANFISPDTIVCVNTDVTFENLSEGYGLKYRWTLGEGDTYTSFEPVKQFRRNGRYTIRLSVTDTAGCVSLLNRPSYIYVGGATANFEMSDSLASCPPLLVHFTNKSQGATNIQWDFNNGNTSVLPNPSQTFTQTGTFRVKLTITGNGGCVDTMVRNVNIRGPQGTITYTPLTGCPPLQVTFTSNTANVKSYIWDFSDGQTSFTTDSTVTYTYLTPGVYRPRVILEDGQACRIPIQGQEDIKITGVRSQIKSLTSYSYCDSAVIAFNDSSISNELIKRWEWDFGDGTKSDQRNPTHKYTVPGKYKVSLFVETFNNCNNISVLPADIVVHTSPKIGNIKDTSFCLPGNVLFKSQWLNPDATTLKWQWDFGNGVTSTLAQPDSVLYNRRGVYQQALLVTHDNGCTARTGSKITVKDRAEAYIVNPGSYFFCNSGTVTFKDSSTNENIIDKWLWDFGDGATSQIRNPVHTYTQPGRYRASLSVETSQSCISVNLLPADIVVAPSPKMEIGADTVLCLSSQMRFVPNWLNADTTKVAYNWDFGNGVTSIVKDPPAVTYTQAGLFRVKLTTRNDYGCSDSVFRQVRVHNDPQVIIGKLDPEVFCDSAVVKLTSNIASTDSIKSYLWTFGDGLTSSDRNPSHVYRTPGHYKIGLSVTTVNNCPAKGEYDGEVVLAIRPRISVSSDSVFCGPSTVSFTGNRLNPDTSILQWKWDFGNGVTSLLEKPLPVFYDKPGVYEAKLFVANRVGCADSVTRSIRINDIPQVQITQLIPDVFCDSAVVKFTGQVTSTDPISGYLWNFGDGNTSTDVSPTYTYTQPGLYKVSLSVNTPFNCPATGNYNGTVTLASSPRIRMIADSVFCGASTVAFDGEWLNRDTTTLAWNWNFGNGTTSNLQKPDAVMFGKAGTYPVKVTAFSPYGCADSVTRSIRINDIPEVQITQLIPDVFCDSAVVKFTGQVRSTDPISSYLWNFGDGNTSTDVSPTYTYTKPGLYKVSLSVNTPFNCPATGNYNGTVTLATSPRIAVRSDSVFCGPAAVAFAGEWLNRDTTNLTWNWNFGNGSTGTGITPDTVQFGQAGTYKVVTIATNNFGCKDSVTRTLVFNDLPKIAIEALPGLVFCDTATVQLKETTMVNGTANSWLWDFGDGTTSGQRSPVHTYNRPGIYNISLRVGTTDNCSSTAQLAGSVIVSASPQISMPGDTLFCIPEHVNFEAEWLNPDTTTLSWAWNFGNGEVSANRNPGLMRYDKPGNYTATVRAINHFGCWDSLSRKIIARDTPRLHISGSTITCRGQGVPLLASGADNYRWEPQISLSCYDCANPVATPVASQVYTVTGSNGPGAGCERSQSLTIGIIQPRKIIASRGDSLCIGESYQLLVSGLDKYNWSPATGLSATNIYNPVARPQQTTVYRVVGTDSLNCFNDTAFITVAVFNKPTVNIVENKITGYAGTQVRLATQSTDATRWRWTPSTGLSCVNCAEPEFTISQQVTYKVWVTNPGGCEATDEVSIEPICSPEGIFVPNTFSPNGDGRNDVFYPMGNGVSIVKSLRVYNRWGEAVFERQQFSPNDPSSGWNGTFKGRSLNPDVYVYVIELLCFNNAAVQLKGNVTLLK